jgi:hypothetical protein
MPAVADLLDCFFSRGWRATDGQSLTAQVAELKAAGCTEIIQEKVSGAKSRPHAAFAPAMW